MKIRCQRCKEWIEREFIGEGHLIWHSCGWCIRVTGISAEIKNGILEVDVNFEKLG